MSSKSLFAISAIGLLMSCKSGLQDSATLAEGQKWEVKRLKSPLIVFNWSTRSGNLIDHLSAQIDQATKMNLEIAKGGKELPPLAMMGMGLYVANDPLLSQSFGNELSCLEIKDNTEVLKAIDPIRGDLNSDIAVSRAEPALIYSFGVGLIPLMEGGSTSGVIRERSVIDFRKSKKIDFSISGGQNGNPKPVDGKEFASIKLDERALRRAASSLNSGRFCEALQVFENNLPALYYSSLAGVRAIRPLPKNEEFETHLTGKALLITLIPEISKMADTIIENRENYPQIRQDLIDLKLLEIRQQDGKSNEKGQLVSTLITALNSAIFQDWNAKKVSVIVQLINLSKILNIPVGVSTTKDLDRKIKEGFDMKLVNWEKENRDDFEFSKKLWKYWNEHSISSFITDK
jgi:hypothetical protein